MIHVWPFGLSVPRPYLYMLGSSSLTRVFCLCKTGLQSLYVNVELITPDHHVVSQHEELSQRCILRENTYTLKFSGGSSYNATAILRKIRCIKDKHHMQPKICDMIWPSSSCAFDLHLQSTVMITIVTDLTPWSPSKHCWRDDNDATMEIKVSSRWRWWSWRCFGDGDQRHKMMMAISYHLYLIACDVDPLCILFCLVRR